LFEFFERPELFIISDAGLGEGRCQFVALKGTARIERIEAGKPSVDGTGVTAIPRNESKISRER
jgi:hypothetical protein